MKSVVLSTTEAEYMALSEVVTELKFIVQLLQTMNITVELPTTVDVDNFWSNMAFKQQKYRRQNKTHRHKNFFCEGISRRWKNHHQVCKIRRK